MTISPKYSLISQDLRAWYPKALKFLAPAVVAGLTVLVAQVKGLNINPVWVALLTWLLQQAMALVSAWASENKYK